MPHRTTIDFGIHLGVSHAQIAVLRGTGTDIIKNNMDADRTPCAVFIDKRGHVQVGQRAKNHQENQNTADAVYVEFMRCMGTDHRYEFKTTGRILMPEELAAELIKSLIGDAQQRLGEHVRAAVLAVPAAFEQQQCAAMKRAGELAGLSQCPLLIEPTAAALAYGFQLDVTKEYWLVYDFGGGTFDACLMKAEDGAMTIVNHGGDNYLGGSDIDWAIIDKIIIPKLMGDHNLPDFSRGNKKWRTALAVIKRATEIAKIQLSRSDSAYLEDCKIKDADGEEIEVDFKLTRDAVIGVTEPIIMRSVEICKRVLKEKNLSPSAITKVILVGGPTLAPYFREILHSNLGIQLDHSVDPLTVMAKGAAVFAGTQQLETLRAPEVVKRIDALTGTKEMEALIAAANNGARTELEQAKPLAQVGAGQRPSFFEGGTDCVNSVTFSPDGRFALSGGTDGTLRLWDVATMKCLRIFAGHTDVVTSGTYSPNGCCVLSGSHDHTLRLWDVATGKCLRTFEGDTEYVTSVVFSPDGRFALFGCIDEFDHENVMLRLLDVATWKCIRVFNGDTTGVTSVAYSPDGRFVLSNSDKAFRLWDVANVKCLRVFEGHTASVASVTFSPDGRFALSGSDDHTLRLWDVATGKCLRVFDGHTEFVCAVAYSPDGRRVLSGSRDHTLQLWDVATGKCLRVFEEHKKEIRSVAYSPDGCFCLFNVNNTLRLLELG